MCSLCFAIKSCCWYDSCAINLSCTPNRLISLETVALIQPGTGDRWLSRPGDISSPGCHLPHENWGWPISSQHSLAIHGWRDNSTYMDIHVPCNLVYDSWKVPPYDAEYARLVSWTYYFFRQFGDFWSGHHTKKWPGSSITAANASFVARKQLEMLAGKCRWRTLGQPNEHIDRSRPRWLFSGMSPVVAVTKTSTIAVGAHRLGPKYHRHFQEVS